MRAVLDTGAFLHSAGIQRISRTHPDISECYTTPSVVAELQDLSSKARLGILLEAGLRVMDPDRESVRLAAEAAAARGEGESLSRTDIDLLGLALQLGAAIVSDDYPLQNVGRALGIHVEPLLQAGSKHLRWKFRCRGCGRYYRGPGECPVCGSPIQRKLK